MTERRREERAPGPYKQLCDRAYQAMREEVVKENPPKKKSN